MIYRLFPLLGWWRAAGTTNHTQMTREPPDERPEYKRAGVELCIWTDLMRAACGQLWRQLKSSGLARVQLASRPAETNAQTDGRDETREWEDCVVGHNWVVCAVWSAEWHNGGRVLARAQVRGESCALDFAQRLDISGPQAN